MHTYILQADAGSCLHALNYSQHHYVPRSAGTHRPGWYWKWHVQAMVNITAIVFCSNVLRECTNFYDPDVVENVRWNVWAMLIIATFVFCRNVLSECVNLCQMVIWISKLKSIVNFIVFNHMGMCYVNVWVLCAFRLHIEVVCVYMCNLYCIHVYVYVLYTCICMCICIHVYVYVCI